MNGIQDEAFLKACYQTLEAMTKAYRQVAGKTNGVAPAKNRKPKTAPAKETLATTAVEKSGERVDVEEKSVPHDLSFVFLANELLKDSLPLPQEAIEAFNDALLESAISEPTLPNRL